MPRPFCTTPGVVALRTPMSIVPQSAVSAAAAINFHRHVFPSEAPCGVNSSVQLTSTYAFHEELTPPTSKPTRNTGMQVINNMRRSDVISNAEQGILKFHSFIGFAKPVSLTIASLPCTSPRPPPPILPPSYCSISHSISSSLSLSSPLAPPTIVPPSYYFYCLDISLSFSCS